MSALALAHQSLRDELIAALQTDPSKQVRTPGFAKQWETAADVILDDFSGSSGEGSLHTLLWIVARASRGENVEIAAALWMTLAAERHAKFHADDLVRQQLEAA